MDIREAVSSMPGWALLVVFAAAFAVAWAIVDFVVTPLVTVHVDTQVLRVEVEQVEDDVQDNKRRLNNVEDELCRFTKEPRVCTFR